MNPYNPYPTYAPYPHPPQMPPRPTRKIDAYGQPYFTYDDSTPPSVNNAQYAQNNGQTEQAVSDLPYILVKTEQEAIDYPMDKYNVGKIYMLSLEDGSAVFGKRINPSNFQVEFKAYDERKESDDTESKNNITPAASVKTLNSINKRLEKIEKFVDSAANLFMGDKADINKDGDE
jgi:hypothetical protein